MTYNLNKELGIIKAEGFNK
ncbi:uncharacterized protein FRV6_16070 [Fusarium oxysporum]|uniref:Uncharacterized protein n=1 Tax=Fusarium oxysporum TaxID=5507 RepID=A0A2H3TTK0_FUSOX|nr:uncharacterized protein FRV6_16070 [Fusarium oxysporum]